MADADPPDSTPKDPSTADAARGDSHSWHEAFFHRRVARAKRHWKRFRIIALILVVLTATAAFILTRPAVLQRIVEPVLTRALGGKVTIEEIHLEGFSTIHIRRLTLTAPEWEGESGEVVVADDIALQFRPAALLAGTFEPRGIQLGHVLVRVAERDDAPGTFNLLALSPEAGSSGSEVRAVRVDLGRLDVETGTASKDGTWHPIGRRSLTGYLAPDPERRDGSLFAFRLSDVEPNGSAINGSWDEETLTLEAALDAIDLDGRILDLLPTAMRRSAAAFDLAGRIRGAQVRWSPKQPLFAEFQVGDMRITLPELDLEDRWSRFRSGKSEQREGLPTMHVREGAVRLEGSHVTFRRLVGELASNSDDPGLVPVPIELGLQIALDSDTIGSVDWSNAEARERWLNETFDAAPFSLSITIRGFDSAKAAPGYDPVLEVPTPIAAALETFGVTSWRLDVEAEFSRGAPTRAADGSIVPQPIRSKGQCFLSNAQGSYDAFPYPMSDVKAHLAFDQNEKGEDTLIVDYLAGTTQVGSTISISGSVTNPGPEAAVDMTIAAPSFVLDEQLIRCFERGKHKTVSYIFHEPSFNALQKAALLPHDDLESLRERLKALEASALAIADPVELERLSIERARVQRMIDVRPFALGGKGAITAHVGREGGIDKPISVTGLVTIEHAGVLIDEFPYPLVVTSGSLSITEQEVSFGTEGLRAITLEGGLVRIAGRMVLEQRPDGVTRARPEITITGVADEITPLLLAAIPASKSNPVAGWPGGALVPTARLLEAAGLRGTVDLHGTILERPEHPGRVETTLRIEITNGSIDSVEAHDVPLALPAGLSLRDLEASLLVTDDVVEFRSLKASDASGIGTIIASGSYATMNAKESVDVRFNGMPIATWVVEALPDAARPIARRWWERWKPRGTFDAHLTLSSDERGSAMTTIEARPREITVAPFGTDVSIRGLDGSVMLVADASGMRGDITSLRIADGTEADAGHLVLNGELEAGATTLRTIDLTAQADGARFESALVDLVMRESGADSLADMIRSTHPAGRFDGSLAFHSIAGGKPDWHLTLDPRSLAMDIAGARPAATFAPGSRVTADASQVRLERIAAAVDGGTVTFDGSIDRSRTPHIATGTMSLDASKWTDAVAALLPPPLNLARDRIAFHADRFLMHDAQLSLHWDPEVGIASPSLYAIDGHLGTEGGTLTAGVPFTEVTGEVDFGFRYEPQVPGAPPTSRDEITLGALISAPAFRIYDRLLTDGTASLSLASDGSTLLLRDVQGTIADGRVVGSADVRLKEQRFNVDVRVTGASLAPLIAPRDPESASGGEVDARLAIEGSTERESERSGRGRIAIRDAAMAKSAITLRLLEISQLMLPISSALKTADIQFFLDGTTASFEKFQLTTSGVSLDGTGTMNTKDFSVDLTLRSRGRLGIFSEIVGAVSDQLYEIQVKGPLNDPTASIRALPGLRSRP